MTQNHSRDDKFVDAMHRACVDLGDEIRNLSCLYRNWRLKAPAKQGDAQKAA